MARSISRTDAGEAAFERDAENSVPIEERILLQEQYIAFMQDTGEYEGWSGLYRRERDNMKLAALIRQARR